MKLMQKAAVLAGLTGAVVLLAGGVASADDGPVGVATGSPGVASGNVIQVPVNVDANVCGNSIALVGLLDPAFGNVCANA